MIGRMIHTRVFGLLVCTAMLTACASQPASAPVEVPHAQNLVAETDDLGMVADATLQLAERHGVDRVLVVFDIDNTLLAMEQGLGSDQWYYWQKKLAHEDPCSALLVSDRIKVQGALYFASAMRPTQADTAAQVSRLQDAGIKVIAVTSRGPDFRLQTFRELRRNGISFWPSALPPQRGYGDSFVPQGAGRGTRYEEGVLLTAGQDKGVMIQDLLQRTGTPSPDVIVIADDKSENLKDVMTAFQSTETAVHAWRYSREDAMVAAFDPDEANATWKALKPALHQIESLLGPNNFDLPANVVREGCGVID